MQELPCHEAFVLATLLGQTEQDFANHSNDEWRDDDALHTAGDFVFCRSAHRVVPPAHPGARAQGLSDSLDATTRGSKAIWDSIIINSTSSCWTDARGAIDSVFEKFDPWSKDAEYDASYQHFVDDLPSLPAASDAKKHLEAGFKDAKSIHTSSNEVLLEGGDEWIAIDVIETKVAERATTGGKSQLWHSFTIVHGHSLCGAKEGKPEDDAFFEQFTVWWDGYFEYTRLDESKINPDAQSKQRESTSLNPAWEKQLKKTFSNEGGIDLIKCCALPKQRTGVPPPPTASPGTAKTSTPTPKPRESPTPQPAKTPTSGNPADRWKNHIVATPTPAAPPIDKDGNHTLVSPTPGPGKGSENGAYLPPISGPRSMIFGTVVDPNTGTTGPTDYIVGIVEPNSKKTFWRGVTDQDGHVKIKLPAIAISLVTLFRFFDKNGEPDKGGQCEVGATHVPNVDQLSNVPVGRTPAVLGGSSSFQRGGADHGLFDLETRGNNPLDTRIVIDGRADGANVVATSDRSVSAQLNDDLPLGRHTFAIESGGKRSNVFQADVLDIAPEPVPPQQVGSVNTVRVHVFGLPPQDTATMTFHVGGAAALINGPAEATVPVKDGLAQIQIRGVHSGESLVQFKLTVVMPGAWPAR